MIEDTVIYTIDKVDDDDRCVGCIWRIKDGHLYYEQFYTDDKPYFSRQCDFVVHAFHTLTLSSLKQVLSKEMGWDILSACHFRRAARKYGWRMTE